MNFLICFFLTLLAVFSSSIENITAIKESNLPIPRIYGISLSSEEGPTIHWLVEKEYQDEPIIGYKVKLWQVGCDTKQKFKIVNGKRQRLTNVMPKLNDTRTLRNLTEYKVEGVDNTNLFLKDIELDIPYHATVSAYGGSGVGQMSTPVRFQYRGRYSCRE